MIVFRPAPGSTWPDAPDGTCKGSAGAVAAVHHRALAQFLENSRRKRLPRAAHAAADHVHLEIQTIHHRRQGNSQSSAHAAEDSLRLLVALDRLVVDFLRVEFRSAPAALASPGASPVVINSRAMRTIAVARSVLLEAARDFRIRTAGHQDRRSYARIACHPGHAVPYFAVQNQAAAHAWCPTSASPCRPRGARRPATSHRDAATLASFSRITGAPRRFSISFAKQDSPTIPAGWATRAPYQFAGR